MNNIPLGTKFNKWTVLERAPDTHKYSYRYKCRCECGTIKDVSGEALINGTTNSCGGGICCKMIIVPIGTKFGKWTTLSLPFRDTIRRNKVFCKCLCECGKISNIDSQRLRDGNAKGCNKCSHLPLPNGQAAYNAAFWSCKKTAERYKRIFSLTIEQFKEIISKPCHYCGTKPFRNIQYRGNDKYKSNGIDRINPSRGYEPGNVVPCCW